MYYSYSNSDVSAAVAGIGIIAWLFLIALGVFETICLWKIFQKAGHGGWKALIPVYNIITYCNVAWKFIYFLAPFIGLIIGFILTGAGVGVGQNGGEGLAAFGLILMYAGLSALVVLDIFAMIKMAKRFGKTGGFAAGLIFLSPVFLAILAFDKSDYDKSRTDAY